MENFMTKQPKHSNCAIEGTAALQVEERQEPRPLARIIAFLPESEQGLDRQADVPGGFGRRTRGRPFSLRARMDSFVCASVEQWRGGSLQGLPFDRMAPWQALVGGCALSLLVFGSLLLKL